MTLKKKKVDIDRIVKEAREKAPTCKTLTQREIVETQEKFEETRRKERRRLGQCPPHLEELARTIKEKGLKIGRQDK